MGFDENKIKQDVFAMESGWILCEVNCQGVMGANFTTQLKRLYPEVFTEYVALCQSVPAAELLGRVQVIPTRNQRLFIICAFGQLEYGRNENIQYLDYDAFRKALEIVNVLFRGKEIVVARNIGCEKTSNGEWERVLPILKGTLRDCDCLYQA